MANIADNLKRLLGTEGHNIQEVLENADSIGGGSGDIPYIQFVNADDTYETFDNFVLGEVRGIDDASNYTGACFIKVDGAAPASQPNTSVLLLGTASMVEVSGDESASYTTVYGAPYMYPAGIVYITFVVTTGDDSVQRNQFVLGTLTPGGS